MVERPYEFKKSIGGEEFQNANRSFDEPEDFEIRTISMRLDYKQVKGFYVHDQDEMKEFGEHLIKADIVMENLTNEQINYGIEHGKETMKDKSPKELIEMAATSALLTLLTISRFQYLMGEEDDE